MAYISEGYNNRFGIYDISEITNPLLLAGIPSFGYAHNAWLNGAGTHLVTGEETIGMTVKIWDIQNLDNINLVGEYLGENSLAHNVHVKGDFVYISHYTAGLKILDIFYPSNPVEVASYDTYPDDDDSGFYGCWGAFPFTNNNYVYASDMQYGLFVFEFDQVRAGWVYGTIIDEGQLAGGVEIKSLLNGKIFTSNQGGYFEFGFPEGVHEFEFALNSTVLDTQYITFLPHEIIENNISFFTYGDLNGDGEINILDVVQLANCILLISCADIEGATAGDIDQNGVWNILDIVLLTNLVLG